MAWCGVVWCGVVWCGVVWCGVVWCGVVWCGVVWWGAATGFSVRSVVWPPDDPSVMAAPCKHLENSLAASVFAHALLLEARPVPSHPAAAQHRRCPQNAAPSPAYRHNVFLTQAQT